MGLLTEEDVKCGKESAILLVSEKILSENVLNRDYMYIITVHSIIFLEVSTPYQQKSNPYMVIYW